MYGASVWYEVCKQKGMRDELIRCQRIVLYGCLRVCRTVSTEAMQVLLGSLPWDLECLRRAALYRVKKGLPLGDNALVENQEYNETDDMCKIINERANELWQARWDNSWKGRTTYAWIRDVIFSARTTKFEPSLKMGYILTGHGTLNQFLYEKGLSDTAACPVCGHDSEDWVHVLCECEAYERFRELDEMGIVGQRGIGWQVNRVLERKEWYDNMCRFVEKAYETRLNMIIRLMEAEEERDA